MFWLVRGHEVDAAGATLFAASMSRRNVAIHRCRQASLASSAAAVSSSSSDGRLRSHRYRCGNVFNAATGALTVYACDAFSAPPYSRSARVTVSSNLSGWAVNTAIIAPGGGVGPTTCVAT